jgi:predicted DsbA family dithiol-disulfide isomerase
LDVNDPAILRVQADMELAERLGIRATPTFIVAIEGKQPVVTWPRGLMEILGSSGGIARVLESRAAE